MNEGDGIATLMLKRTTGTDRAASVDYTTSNGTATAGTDYTAASGTANFIVGQTTSTIQVPITNDTLQEPGADETFNVTLSNPGGNASIPAENIATVSIVDNEGTPSLSVANTQVLEGNSGRTSLAFTVSLAPQSLQTVTVRIATTGGTAVASGTGQDYLPGSATLTFAPGQSSKVFVVGVVGDVRVEDDDTVNVALTSAQGAPVSRATAVGTILNDDEPGGGGTISFLSSSYSVNENVQDATANPRNSIRITLGRSGKLDLINEQSATVRFSTGTGTAT
ncbi:MAG: hypothetical protein EON58_21710, partial [Alphaproteobacteria bacterium]